VNGHDWACVCTECCEIDAVHASKAGASKMAERAASLAAEVRRLRALIRKTEDEVCELVQAGSTIAELVDVVRAAVVQDGWA
jgi:hypothetical protein